MTDGFETFTGYMMQFHRYIQKIKEIEMRRFGLHATHTMCLHYLSKNEEGLTATQLSQICREDKAAISRCIKQLTALGYVYAEQTDARRSYRSLLFLSESGKELTKNMEMRLQEVISTLGEGIDECRREALYQTLEVIMKNFASYIEAQTNTDE